MRKFSTSLSGYNKIEVNNFVNEVTGEYESMLAKLKKQDEEIANLKLKQLPNGNVTIERVVKKMDKYRVSALIYVLWYINEFCKDLYASSDYDYTTLIN